MHRLQTDDDYTAETPPQVEQARSQDRNNLAKGLSPRLPGAGGAAYPKFEDTVRTRSASFERGYSPRSPPVSSMAQGHPQVRPFPPPLVAHSSRGRKGQPAPLGSELAGRERRGEQTSGRSGVGWLLRRARSDGGTLQHTAPLLSASSALSASRCPKALCICSARRDSASHTLHPRCSSSSSFRLRSDWPRRQGRRSSGSSAL